MSDAKSDSRAGMPCPRCQVDLLMSDRQGIEIDYCPKCRGVWLDRGELDKIIERNAQYSAAPPQEPARASAPAQSPWTAPAGTPSPAPGPAPGWGPSYDPYDRSHGSQHGDDRHRAGYGSHNSFLGRLFGGH